MAIKPIENANVLSSTIQSSVAKNESILGFKANLSQKNALDVIEKLTQLTNAKMHCFAITTVGWRSTTFGIC